MRVWDATLEDLTAVVEIYNSTIPSRIVSADTGVQGIINAQAPSMTS